jgi:N-acetylglutamate synthase-like GNAT family acetyltransferase
MEESNFAAMHLTTIGFQPAEKTRCPERVQSELCSK